MKWGIIGGIVLYLITLGSVSYHRYSATQPKKKGRDEVQSELNTIVRRLNRIEGRLLRNTRTAF